LADALVEALAIRRPRSWLEPSYGAGVFLSALADHGVSADAVVGLELSKVKLPDAETKAICLRGTEALDWMRKSRQKFDAVIGNPPYASASDLTSRMRSRIASTTNPATGSCLTLSSNLWIAFVIESLSVLDVGGSLGFVLPAAWDYADYAAELRRWLPLQFESFAVFRSDRPLFDEVLEGCVVIVGQGYKLRSQLIARFECRDRESICAALRRFGVQWPGSPDPPHHTVTRTETGTLRDFLSVRLGGVTGQASYFVLTEARRLELDLPVSSVKPVLTKARHLRWPIVVRKHWEELRKSGEPVWLFRPAASDLETGAVRKYLRLPVERGGCDRTAHKISIRDRWYETPLPQRVDGFLTGMSDDGIRLVFSDMRNLSATNTLYTVTFRPTVSIGARFGIARYLLESEMRTRVGELQRRYAGGLKKLEPSDILGLPIPSSIRECSREEYSEAFNAAFRGNN